MTSRTRRRSTAPSPNPRNGVLISSDGGKTWSEHGNIRLTPNSRYFGWAENDLFEHPDGRITMVIRADGLGGIALQSRKSKDGGKTWPRVRQRHGDPESQAARPRSTTSAATPCAILHNPEQQAPQLRWRCGSASTA